MTTPAPRPQVSGLAREVAGSRALEAVLTTAPGEPPAYITNITNKVLLYYYAMPLSFYTTTPEAEAQPVKSGAWPL